MKPFEHLASSDRIVAVLAISFCLLSYIPAYLDYYWTLAIPPVLVFLFFLLVKPDYVWYSIPIVMPFSINPNDIELNKLSISLPCEPLLIILFGFLVLVVVFRPHQFNSKLFTHPVALAVYFYLGWVFITALASVDKVVSLKFFLSKLWLIVPMLFVSNLFFTEKHHVVRFFWFLLIALSIVSLYNIVHLSFYNFADKPSQGTMQPFFKDHTVFGAVLAMAWPMAWAMMLRAPDLFKRFVSFIILIVMSFCLVVTYSRGAYVSLIPIFLFPLAVKLGLRFRSFVALLIGAAVLVIINFESIVFRLETNKAARSGEGGSNIESIANITSDESNLERINRWVSAIEMWKIKPHMGWGPGTYMFEYAPFQLSYNYTSISTNHGDVGNAHSEYLGLLAETGWPGLLIFISLILALMHAAFSNVDLLRDKSDKALNMAATCGLLSYFTHGFLNNFLDTDKASVVFWSLISLIVTFHLQTKKSISMVAR